MYANQPIISYNRTEYCQINTELTIIRTSGLVAIVEDCHANRFPCMVEMMSENEVVVVVEEVIEEPKAQLTLF